MRRLWLPDKPSKQDWPVPGMLREKEVEALTKHLTSYTLTSFMKRRLESLNCVLNCDRCGDPLQVGDKVVCKRGIRGSRGAKSSRAKRYHEQCWEGMFF